jgi:hypothetical protein
MAFCMPSCRRAAPARHPVQMPEEMAMSTDAERDVMAELAAEEQPQGAEPLDEYETGEGEGI